MLEPLVTSTVGLLPIHEHMEDDIFIVGYPKSGNTWFQNLVSGIVFGANPLYAPDTLIQELVPDVHYKHFYKRFWTPMFFKSHLLPQQDYRRVIYLLRDGRDAMVSYYHFLGAVGGRKPDFAEMVRTGEGIYCKWHEHVEAWSSNPFGAEIITIRYEDLRRDPLPDLRRICEFAKIDRTDLWLRQVAENAIFERMQEKEKAGQIHWDNQAWPKDRLFMRRGTVGSYEDEMPAEVQNIFMRDAEETLKKHGYM